MLDAQARMSQIGERAHPPRTQSATNRLLRVSRDDCIKASGNFFFFLFPRTDCCGCRRVLYPSLTQQYSFELQDSKQRRLAGAPGMPLPAQDQLKALTRLTIMPPWCCLMLLKKGT